MHAPRACLAVLRSAAVEFGRVVSVRDQVHDVHRGKWGRGIQLEALVVNLSVLCAFRAVRLKQHGRESFGTFDTSFNRQRLCARMRLSIGFATSLELGLGAD